MKTPNIRNILVPIDFSRMSIQAIETAKTFAERFGAAIHLAHVHQFYFPAGFNAPMPPVAPFSTYTYDQEAEKRATRELIRLTRKHELSEANTHLLTGAPSFDEICRLAKDLPADLIIMPTHGRTGLKHVFLGSTAERIVQHSPCPVFVVRQRRRRSNNGSSARPHTILVPIDFSRRSLAGLKYAIGFAQETGAKIVLLHVVPYIYTSNGWVTYELTDVTRAAEREAVQQMKKSVRAAKFGAVQFETAIVSGNAVERICDYARERDVDLIITSTHGRTGLEHVLIGSVAENVVRRAPCSVVAVPSFPARGTTKSRQSLRANSRRTLQRKSTIPPRLLIEREKLTRKHRKLTTHPFAERRKTNRFREGHLLK